MIILKNGAILRSGRNPLALFLLGACILNGIVGVLAPEATAGAVARVLPAWATTLWYWGLLISAGVSGTGILLRGLKSLLVERAGLLLLALLLGVYSVAVLVVAEWKGLFVSVLVAAFAGAAVARFAQIQRDLRKATAAVEELRPGGE